VGAPAGLGEPVVPFMMVPTLTRKDLLYDLLSTLDVRVGTLLVVDNGSQDFGEMWLPAVDHLRLVNLGANLGVAASWNLGIKAGFQHDWVMVVSDDVTMPRGALAEFAALSGEDRIVLSSTWPHWCAFTIGMRVVQQVGLFDENFYPAYFEDTDYERRLTDAKIAPVYGPEVLHKNSSTLKTQGRHFTKANTVSFDANQSYIQNKWGDGHAEPWDPYRWRLLTWT
jgi:GT2 family glycosyltransferase